MFSSGKLGLISSNFLEEILHAASVFNSTKCCEPVDEIAQRTMTSSGDATSVSNDAHARGSFQEIDLFLEYCELLGDAQLFLSNNNGIDGYLNSCEHSVSEEVACSGLISLLRNHKLSQINEELTKKIARLIFSAPDRCHSKLAGVFCTVLVSPNRNLDHTIAIVLDSLYQRHCSNPHQLQYIISSCIRLLLTQLHSESDYVQLFQFFLKCTSMVPGFRGDLWISGILFEAISNDTFVKSLIGQLIDETISYIRTQSDFVYELHVVLAILFSLSLRSSMVRTISTKTLDSAYGYLEEISKRGDQIGHFLQIFYGHYLSVLNQNDVLMELMKEESMLPASLLALLEQFPKKRYDNILSSLSLINTTLSGPLNCSTSFHIIPRWLKILKLICGKFWKKMGASKVPNLVTTISPFRGLKNPSTICYGNSALQMLSKIPLFRNGFDRHCESGESCGDLHKELKEVFDSLAAPLDEKVVDASDFIRKSRPRYFEDWAHEDAQEYIGHLLGQLQAESTSETSPASPSYISETFEGCQSRVSYCATCCEAIDKREDTFTTLMVPLKQNEGDTPSIQEIVDSLSTELIEVAPKCEKCGGGDNGVYSRNVDVTFRRAPPCLLLNLKIFYYDMATASTEKYMSKFDINETITLKLEDETVRRYQLFGIVLHAGGLATSGHYLWACKMAGQWAIFSDEDVIMVDSEQPFSASDFSPYILVYTSANE